MPRLTQPNPVSTAVMPLAPAAGQAPATGRGSPDPGRVTTPFLFLGELPSDPTDLPDDGVARWWKIPGAVKCWLDGTKYTIAPPSASGHDAVTLAAAAATLMDLSGQEIDFDTQVKNLVLAGPSSGGDAKPTFRTLVAADIPTLKVSKTYLYEFPAEDMAVGDFIPENAIRIPAAGKHGDITWGTAYVRCEVAGTGTNTILFRTSTTLTGARTTRATINLGTAREASASITLTESDGMYLWVECSVVGATAPQKVTCQVDAEETVY